MKRFYKLVFINLVLISFFTVNCVAQNFLQKKISVSVSKKPLSDVLSAIEKQGGFFFSYNSNLLKADSLVTIHAKNESLSEILHSLFGNKFQYRQQNNHVIIIPTVIREILEINGIVENRETGEPVPYATVYVRNQLVAAMTNENGTFKLQLKRRSASDSISVSRVSYADTTIVLHQDESAPIIIKITGVNKPLDSVVVSMMQRDWLARSILSSRQIINSINLNHFFVKQPFQFSIFPGIGSHGKMSSQLVNKFSFNLFGGYNGGVNGIEIGGLYNITNKNVRYFQAAGLFNMVGGHAEGFQIAGLFNKDSTMDGFQAAGLYNKTIKAKGFQMAAFNKNDTMQGFQAGVININRQFKGVQIGVINIADTIKGIPIGLVNIGKSGIHHLSLSYNEMGFALLSYKSGNPKFYNILIAGSRLNFNEKAFSIGYGLGKKISIKKNISINPELASLYFYNGNKEKQNISGRLQLNLQFKLSKSLSLYAGPAITVLYSRPGDIPNGYKSDLSNGANDFFISKNVTGWLGWNVGINLF